MSCDGVFALSPICQATQALAGGAVSGVADTAFSHLAGYFALSATSATEWLWQEISAATTLDLQSPTLLREMSLTGAIAGTLCLGLFVVQVITATLRGHPPALGRALGGLIVSFIGCTFALATTRILLASVDQLSADVVHASLGVDIGQMGEKLPLVALANVANPATALILSVVVLVAVVIVWAAMMVRKVTLLVAAVLAPLAFAGATADITRGWVRKWIELVTAMIAAKLILVIILSIGASVINGAGQAGNGAPQSVTQLASGALLLLVGGFAPWMAIRMVHFAGDSMHAAHASAIQAGAGARSLVAAPRKVSAAQGQLRSLAPAHSSPRSGHNTSPGMTGMPHSSPRPASAPSRVLGSPGIARPTAGPGASATAGIGGVAAASAAAAGAAAAVALPALAAQASARAGGASVAQAQATAGPRQHPPAPVPQTQPEGVAPSRGWVPQRPPTQT